MVNSFWKRSTCAIKRSRRRNLPAIALAACLVTASFAVAKDLPPLPIPTEEQLQKGRVLLDKIAFVMENIALTDEVAVMKEFGFIDLYSRDYATHRDVGPRGKNGTTMLPVELAGTGFAYIGLNPWVKSPRINRSAMLSLGFAAEDACISLEDVKRKFSSVAKKTSVEPVIYSHPVAEPKRLNDVPRLLFGGLSSRFTAAARASFTFEYQTCAKSFSYLYQAN